MLPRHFKGSLLFRVGWLDVPSFWWLSLTKKHPWLCHWFKDGIYDLLPVLIMAPLARDCRILNVWHAAHKPLHFWPSLPFLQISSLKLQAVDNSQMCLHPSAPPCCTFTVPRVVVLPKGNLQAMGEEDCNFYRFDSNEKGELQEWRVYSPHCSIFTERTVYVTCFWPEHSASWLCMIIALCTLCSSDSCNLHIIMFFNILVTKVFFISTVAGC